MNSFYKRFIASSFFLLFVSNSILFAQDSKVVLDEIAGNLVKNIANDQSESIYLHIDKPVYRAGGIIWFRAFLLNSQTRQRSTLSKIVYVDIVNENDSVIDYVMLNAREQAMDGGLKLSPMIPEGNYRLRSYTRHLLEFAPDRMFITPVYIISDIKSVQVRPIAGTKDSIIMGFYPEGGTIINGINNVIAVRSIDLHSNPVQLNGFVKDDRDSVVARFTTNSSGFGKFDLFPPTKNRKYIAYLNSRNSQVVYSYPLPTIDVRSYQLSLVMQDPQQLKFRVGLGDSVYNKRTVSYILAVSRGRLVFASSGNGMYEVTIQKADLPEGIATFYLFNDQKQKVSSRNVYIGKTPVQVDVVTNKKTYALREQVKMDITVKDMAGKPVPGIFSVSVTDNRYIQWPQQYLPLAAYHTVQNLQITKNELDSFLNRSGTGVIDLIMLTSAEQKNNRSFTAPNSFSLPVDSTLSIRGSIDARNNNQVADQVVTLFSTISQGMMLADTTLSAGTFEFDRLNYYDSTQFVLQVSNLKGDKKDLGINYHPLTPPKVKSIRFPVLQDSGIINLISDFRSSHADSSVTGNIKEWLQDVELRSLRGSGSRSKKNNSFSRFITGEQLDKLQLSNTANAVMMLPGVIMMNGRLTIRGGLMGTSPDLSQIEPLIVVDGVPVPLGSGSAVDYLNSIPPGNIDYIEVLTGPEAAMYASRSGNGVILIKTANQLRTPPGNWNGMTYIYPKGYHVPPLFYMPRYYVDVVKEFPFTDNRSTIYWNGEILTNNEGKASVFFYVADEPATYTITIQGITSKGELIYKTHSIKRGQ